MNDLTEKLSYNSYLNVIKVYTKFQDFMKSTLHFIKFFMKYTLNFMYMYTNIFFSYKYIKCNVMS